MALSKLSGTLRGAGLTAGALGNIRLFDAGALHIANNYPLLLVFHLTGRCRLFLAGRHHLTLTTPGQCLLLSRKTPCILADEAADVQTASRTGHFTRRHDDTIVPVIRAGKGRPTASMLVCGFDIANPHPIFAALPGAFGYQTEADVNVSAVIESLIQSPRHTVPDVLIELLGHYLLAQALIHFANSRSTGETGAPDLPLASSIRSVVHMIDLRPQADWSVDRLARLAGLARSSFMEAFDREVGLSPMRYVAERRMRKAEELLITTSEPIAQISWQCGFESPAAFTRAFRRHCGQSPLHFRKQNRQQGSEFSTGTHWDAFLN